MENCTYICVCVCCERYVQREKEKASWRGKGDDDGDGWGCFGCLKNMGLNGECVEREREREDCVGWLLGGVENGLEGDLHLCMCLSMEREIEREGDVWSSCL